MNSSRYISDFIEKEKKETLSKRNVKQLSIPSIAKVLRISFRIKSKQFAFRDVLEVLSLYE